MLAVAGLILVAYGYIELELRDFWWWDYAAMWRMFGQVVERTESWDRQRDLWAYSCITMGAVLIVVSLLSLAGVSVA
jgi:hypothetical protein